jgi:hypothetical protein
MSKIERFIKLSTKESEIRKGTVSIDVETNCKDKIEIQAMLNILVKADPEWIDYFIKALHSVNDPRNPGRSHFEVDE